MLILGMLMSFQASGLVYAGVDFTMGAGDLAMSGREFVYDIPRFASKEEALSWANKQKWVEPQRRQLESYVAKIGYLYDVETDFRQKAFFYHQWERSNLALRIISNYRRLGIKGVERVGSEFYACEIPLKVRALSNNKATPYKERGWLLTI